jgi:hypothetical protein
VAAHAGSKAISRANRVAEVNDAARKITHNLVSGDVSSLASDLTSLSGAWEDLAPSLRYHMLVALRPHSTEAALREAKRRLRGGAATDHDGAFLAVFRSGLVTTRDVTLDASLAPLLVSTDLSSYTVAVDDRILVAYEGLLHPQGDMLADWKKRADIRIEQLGEVDVTSDLLHETSNDVFARVVSENKENKAVVLVWIPKGTHQNESQQDAR